MHLPKTIKDNADTLQSYIRDLKSWENMAQEQDRKLQNLSKTSNIENEKLPPPRNVPILKPQTAKSMPHKSTLEKDGPSNKTRISSYDYAAWDKFNVDDVLNFEEDEPEPTQGENEKPKKIIEIDVNEDGEVLNKEVLEKFRKMNETPNVEGSKTSNMEVNKGSRRTNAKNPKVTEKSKMEKAEKLKEEGNKFYLSGSWKDAVAKYTRGIALDPNNPLLPANRAMAYIKMDEFAAAERDCTRSLQLDPVYIKALLRRATAREHLGDEKGAGMDYRKVLQLEPWNKDAKMALTKISGNIVAEGSNMLKKEKKKVSFGGNGEVSKLKSKSGEDPKVSKLKSKIGEDVEASKLKSKSILKDLENRLEKDTQDKVNNCERIQVNTDKTRDTGLSVPSGELTKEEILSLNELSTKVLEENKQKIVEPGVILPINKPLHLRSTKPLERVDIKVLETIEQMDEILNNVEQKDRSDHPMETNNEFRNLIETKDSPDKAIETKHDSDHPKETNNRSDNPIETKDKSHNNPIEVKDKSDNPIETKDLSDYPIETRDKSDNPIETKDLSDNPIETKDRLDNPVEKKAKYDNLIETKHEAENTIRTKEESDNTIKKKHQINQDKSLKDAKSPIHHLDTSIDSIHIPDVPKTSHRFHQEWRKLKNHEAIAIKFLTSIPMKTLKNYEIDSDTLEDMIQFLSTSEVPLKTVHDCVTGVVNSRSFSINHMLLSDDSQKKLEDLLEKVKDYH